MERTIIAVYGRAGEGKSNTVKKVCELLLATFPNAISSISPIDYSADIFLFIQLGSIKIGIESQGDPNSRMFETVEKLIRDEKCDIVLCTTRTEGETVNEVDRLSDEYDYHTLWMSSYWSPTLQYKDVLNRLAAESIIEAIKSLILGRIQ